MGSRRVTAKRGFGGISALPTGRFSLLLGGERSLVSVEFLFSLFIARPSPFHILDEVDAALDDVNLGRLLEVDTELRKRAKLLVIAHQKRTMEIRRRPVRGHHARRRRVDRYLAAVAGGDHHPGLTRADLLWCGLADDAGTCRGRPGHP